MSSVETLALPKDFGAVDPAIYDSLRQRLGVGWSVRYFFEGDACTSINVAADAGTDIRSIPVAPEQQKSMGLFASTLLEEIGVLTDEAREWLFANGFTLHSITYDTRHVSPEACQRQSQPHFDIGKALFTGEHFGPAYILGSDTDERITVETDGGRLVGHDQTNLHHSRPSPLSERECRAVVKISAVTK